MPFEHKIIDLSNKPPEFLEKYAQASGSTTARAKVPLLECGGDNDTQELVIESDVVAKFVAERLGSKNVMYPDDERRQRIDRFLAAFETVTKSYYDLLGARTSAQVEQAKQEFGTALCSLEEHLEGPFCLGEQFSVAECITAPWVHRFLVTLPYFRNIVVARDVVLPQLVATWLQAVANRPSVLETNGNEEYVLKSTQNYFVDYISPGSPAALN